MATTQEFYIREASENEARGPYNLEQLVSLAETGQVTIETLWYDPAIEDWSLIGNNDTLKGTLFPEKRKLRIKAREPIATNRHLETQAPITVEDMLAGAEGRTADTKDKVDPLHMQLQAARLGMWAAVVALALCAAGEMLPVADAIAALDLGKIIEQPLAFLGAADLLLAVMLGLGVATLYPVVRFRAALGFGLFGFIFFTQGANLAILELAAGCGGLFLLTLWVDMVPVIVVSLLAVLGMAGVAYTQIST
jgi:hypothetical protein